MSQQSDPKYLTVAEAHQVIAATGLPATLRQVTRWAHERKLPFFKWGRALYIDRNELVMSFRRLQLKAASGK